MNAAILMPGESSNKARIYRYEQQIRERFAMDLDDQYPVSLEIHPSNICNLSCRFCSYAETRKNEILSKDVLLKLCTEIAQLKELKSVVFSGGGEPCVHKSLPEAIDLLVNQGIEVGVITNGTILNDKLLDALLRTSWVRFSINSIDPVNYFKIMGPNMKNMYNRVLNNMRMISKNVNTSKSPLLGFSVIMNKSTESIDDHIKFLNVASDINVDYVSYRPLFRSNDLKSEMEFAHFEEMKHQIEMHAKNLKIAHQFPKFINNIDKVNAFSNSTSGEICYITKLGLIAAVGADGEVYPCYSLYMNGRSKNYSYGNINDERFQDIWKKRKSVSNCINTKECPQCRFSGHNNVMDGMIKSSGPSTNSCSSIEGIDPHWKFL